MKPCKVCKELKYTNPYSDSYKCIKCGRLFVITHKMMLIKTTEIVKTPNSPTKEIRHLVSKLRRIV